MEAVASDALVLNPAASIAHALPQGMVFDLTAEQYTRDWALPQFYFGMRYPRDKQVGRPDIPNDGRPHRIRGRPVLSGRGQLHFCLPAGAFNRDRNAATLTAVHGRRLPLLGIDGQVSHQITPEARVTVFGDYVNTDLRSENDNLPRISSGRLGARYGYA